MFAAIIAAAASAATLHIFYTAVRHQWPQNYYSLEVSTVDYQVSRSLFRYLSFRLVPTFLVFLFATVTVDRLQKATLLVTILSPLFYYATSDIPYVVGKFRRLRRSRRPDGLLVVGLLWIVPLSAVSFLAFFLRDIFDVLIPPPSEINSNVWAGVFAAVGAVYLQRVAMRVPSTDQLARQSIDSNRALLLVAERVATDAGLDAGIIKALIVAEDLQRPRWVRRLERMSALVVRTSSGIMQVRSTGALSDAESIKIAVQSLAQNMPTRTRDDYDWAKKVALEWNPDEGYATLVDSIYWSSEEFRNE